MTEPFTVRKIAALFDISCCVARECGLDVECNHPPLPGPTWRQRTRWWFERQWGRLPRVHFGSCCADDCDCW